jgi:hypothetical protein
VKKRLRFTGENPPPSLWDRFPNWENAFDEETLPDQDETTVRPSSNRKSIDSDVSFTAGDAILASGEKVPALLNILDGEIVWIYVYPDPSRNECRSLRFDNFSKSWESMEEEWMPEQEGLIPAPVEDSRVFPMTVRSRLPLQKTKSKLSFEVKKPARRT